MGKIVFRSALAGLAFFAVLVALNRFDKPQAPDGTGERDLLPASLEPGNGAFWLLFLGEPESEGLDVGRKAPEYGRLLGRLERVERLTWQVSPRTKSLGVRYWQMIAEIPFPRLPVQDWPGFLRTERGRLTGLRSSLVVLLGRFGRMIRSETVADFGYGVEWDRSYALTSFVQATARLHAALALLDAEDGRWPLAAGELLAAFGFGDRLTAAAQSFFFYTLGRSILEAALDGLGGLLSLPGCPPEIRASLLEALPPLSGPRFSARGALVGEFLWISERVERGDRWLQSELAFREILPGRSGERTRMAVNILLGRELGPATYTRLREAAFDLFLMKNRTRGYFRDALSWLLALDAAPPFRWGALKGAPQSFRGPAPGWLWNPSGKLLYESLDPVRQKRSIERGHLTRALYDLIRISASSGSSTAIDPFSGRPYGWDEDRGLLWSVGVDGQDDRGDPEKDLVLPVRKSVSRL